VATEGLSITENIAACGVPLPKKLIKILENLKSDNDVEGVD
jgi:phage-related holin